MKYINRTYPLFASCGLNCGLCPRYYTAGSSRCPGCAGEGFSEVHPSCGVLSCCQRKGIEYCFECEEFPCKRYDDAGSTDSFISHRNRLRDLDKAKLIGMETYEAELNEKVGLLETLLNNYDDGRRKSFYCSATNLLELQDIKSVMNQLDRLAGEIEQGAPLNLESKIKAAAAVRLFEEMAALREITLKLRK